MEGTVIHPTTTPNGPNPEILEEVNRQRKKDIASLIPLLVGFSQRKTYPTQKEIASQVFAEVGLPRKEIANLVPLRFWTIASTIPQDFERNCHPKNEVANPAPSFMLLNKLSPREEIAAKTVPEVFGAGYFSNKDIVR